MEEATRWDIVLLTKGEGYFHGIVLVEVFWKMKAIIIYNIRGKVVDFHYMLHDFQSNRGKGRSSLEENIMQQMVEMR